MIKYYLTVSPADKLVIKVGGAVINGYWTDATSDDHHVISEHATMAEAEQARDTAKQARAES